MEIHPNSGGQRFKIIIKLENVHSLLFRLFKEIVVFNDVLLLFQTPHSLIG